MDRTRRIGETMQTSLRGIAEKAANQNVYLHYALDLWFEKVIQKQWRGEACLIRYADDFVCAFEYQQDAEAFYQMLGERLGKFKLELSAEKTRIIEFKRQQSKTYFEFLGFEFRWGKDRKGRAHL
jgi:retron-type reverse transcriptase